MITCFIWVLFMAIMDCANGTSVAVTLVVQTPKSLTMGKSAESDLHNMCGWGYLPYLDQNFPKISIVKLSRGEK